MLINFIIVAAVAAVLVLLISYICFRIVFYVPRGKKEITDELPVPSGKVYEPYHEMMKKWIVDARSREYKDCYIKSFDGLTLHAKYFEYSKDAALEIMFHGYRGSAERDLSGGLQRCFALGRNVLLVDQRTSCGSEGNVISFGINEHRDCLSWIDFAVKEFGDDITILITGISMGASTVLMAAGKPLPPNVKGVLADCGFSTAKDIIKKCSRDLHLPADVVYPFIKLGAKLYGHFDLEEYSALEAVQNCTIPVIFVHNDGDDFVPCEMSRILYNACKATKRLVIMEGDGHGLAYLLDNKKYFDNLTEFHAQNGIPTKLLEPII